MKSSRKNRRYLLGGEIIKKFERGQNFCLEKFPGAAVAIDYKVEPLFEESCSPAQTSDLRGGEKKRNLKRGMKGTAEQ